MLAQAGQGCFLLVVLWEDAHAWETDQITRRSEPLEDVTDRANAYVRERLDEAVARANQLTRCDASSARIHDVLASEIRRATSKDTPVKGRGFVRSLGYGDVAAWLETADLPRRSFLDRSDVFGGIPSGIAPILAVAGTASTVRLADVLLGTDKPDHFFEDGWRYWLRSGHEHPERAVAWGTWTENTFLGLYTSSAFSYADLYANWQGWRYFDGLFDPVDGDFELDADGCVRVRRPFDFRRWVDWRWDEALNPSVYTRKVEDWLAETLPSRRDVLCRDVATWIDEVRRHRPEVRAEGPGCPWASEDAPPRSDPFDLETLCADVLARAADGPP